MWPIWPQCGQICYDLAWFDVRLFCNRRELLVVVPPVELTLGPEKLPITCITNETAATHATQITDNYRALSIVIYCGWGGEAIIASQASRDPKVSRDLIANLLR